MQCTSPAGVDVDVSIGDDRGIRAARWLLRCQERWPALRPLVLLLKGVLRVLELHDVSQGVASPVLIRPRMQQTLIRFYVGSFIMYIKRVMIMIAFKCHCNNIPSSTEAG